MLSTAQLEANQRYQDRNRETINQQSRERYAAKKYLLFAPKVDVANERRVAFLAALDAIDDPDVRNEIMDLIEATAILFMQKGGLKQYAAMNQAQEFVAACVWNKAQARRR